MADKQKHNKRIKLPATLNEVGHFSPLKDEGLTFDEVAMRVEQGFVNADNTRRGKSIPGIVLSNLFTFFNIVYLVITVILCVSGLADQCTYLPVVIANTAIAMIQEIKSKLTLDKLNLITEPQIKVVRDKEVVEIPVRELVLDDIAYLSSGEQISADCIVIDGYVEVNEAILTGESDAVTKRAGDTLYAGSYIVSGNCTVQITAVGKYNYIASLTGRAKQYQKPRSQMLSALKKILVFIAIIIVPMTICLYMVNATAVGDDLSKFSFLNLNHKALNPTAASIISMIPAGPFLLTSVALATSFLRLAKNNTMVQELYCIEMLARVDTLCLDKTGTITDGTMQVVESIDLRSAGSTYTVREIISSFNVALPSDNMTSRALKQYFGTPKNPSLQAVATIPFSSERKLSAVSFKGAGTYILGAPEFALKTPNERVNDLVKKYAAQGLRVLLLAHSTTTIYDSSTLPQVCRPVAVIVIEDHIRADAPDTIDWFMKNDVDVKVISGDNPVTVSNIALRVGIRDADKYISLEGMSDEDVAAAATEYTVFGRVTPDQKAILVKALRAAKHTVAMTGDGVNDVLAMKESDCSISIASGSSAARQVSHLVLMDDSFANLPKVVAEGRRVVNNIQSSSSMYFMKTIYVIVINLMLILLHFAFGKTMESPLVSNRSVMLMDWVIVALPTFFLALQPNEKRIKGAFFNNILKNCMPCSLTFLVTTVALYVMHGLDVTLVPVDQLGTLVTLTYTFGGLFALYYACQPFNKWKVVLFVSIWAIVLAAVFIGWTYNFFNYAPLGREQLLLLLVEVLATPFIMYAFNRIFNVNVKRKPKLKMKK